MKLREYFTGLVDYKRQCGMCPKTLHEYQIHIKGTLNEAVGDIEVAELRQIDVGKVIEAGRQHGRFGPLRGAVVFRQLLKYLKESGIKFDFDWRDVRVPPEPRKKVEWLDKEEFEQVRNSFDLNTLSGLRDRALIENLCVTGMRIGEALSLNRDDINWEKKEAEIINGKTKDREMIYFTEESLAWLKRYLDWRNDKSPAVFASCNGRRSSACGIRRTIHNATEAAGIKKRIHPPFIPQYFRNRITAGRCGYKERANSYAP